MEYPYCFLRCSAGLLTPLKSRQSKSNLSSVDRLGVLNSLHRRNRLYLNNHIY